MLETFLKVLIVVNFLTTILVLVYVSKRFDSEVKANRAVIAKQEQKILEFECQTDPSTW